MVGKEIAVTGQVAKVWHDVFDSSTIGHDDDFFELGGGSVQAVQLVRDLEDHFGCDLDIMLVFEAPTIRLMSARLAETLEQIRADH